MAGVPHPNVSPLSTTASPRASPRKTCRTRRRCSMSYQDRAVSCLTEPVIHSYLLYRTSFLLTRAAASPPDVRQLGIFVVRSCGFATRCEAATHLCYLELRLRRPM